MEIYFHLQCPKEYLKNKFKTLGPPTESRDSVRLLCQKKNLNVNRLCHVEITMLKLISSSSLDEVVSH